MTSLGHAVIAPGEGYPPRTHPCLYDFSWEKGRTLPEFSLMLITCGEGIFETRKTGKLPLVDGTAILLFPGVWHRYRPDRNTGWTEKWVHFNGEFPHKLMDHGILSPERPVLQPDGFRSLETALDRLLELAHRDPASNSLQISLVALGALASALGETPPPPQLTSRVVRKRVDPIAATAIDYIWTRSHKVLSVDDVAENVGMTRRTLERHMTAAVGHSVLDEIVQCRFCRAERLLRETDLPAKAIVFLAGFGSVQNMRTSFSTAPAAPQASIASATGPNWGRGSAGRSAVSQIGVPAFWPSSGTSAFFGGTRSRPSRQCRRLSRSERPPDGFPCAR